MIPASSWSLVRDTPSLEVKFGIAGSPPVDSGFSAEERKLVFESRKILEVPELAISA